MIRLTENALIIEIPCSEPIEELNYLQQAICDIMSVIDYEAQNTPQMSGAIWQLVGLMKATLISADQSVALVSSLKRNKDLKKAFN